MRSTDEAQKYVRFTADCIGYVVTWHCIVLNYRQLLAGYQYMTICVSSNITA